MAKKRNINAIMIDMQKLDREHINRLAKYAEEIQDIFKDQITELVRLGYATPSPTGSLFKFDRLESSKEKANTILREFASRIELKIAEGISKEWTFANSKNDVLVDRLFTSGRLTKESLEKFKPRNEEALNAFQQRSSDGIKISNKVWNITKQFKSEVEDTISAGLITGQSADSMARDLRRNLNEPDRIFRRVRDEKGGLKLSNKAKNYHPGQGVYRSSAKNAKRLTRTEINIAYHTSDGLRWSQQEFVRGIKVFLSPQHPRPDICDKLKGDYPKNFKFVGWHSQCICGAVPILISDEELDAMELADLNDIPYTTPRVITNLPRGFNDWIQENKERAKGWKNMPYFVRDNLKDGKITGKYEGGIK